jgi:phosphoenolpyruvate carboxykinase (ATP)
MVRVRDGARRGQEGCGKVVCDPRSTWRDPAAYDVKARELAEMFRENFRKFAADAGERVVAAGPLP